MTELVSYQTSDSDEIAGALTGWEQHYTQLGSGCLSAELVRVSLPDATLFLESSNLHIQQNMCPPHGHVVIGIPLFTSGGSLFNGLPLDSQSLLVLEGDRELEISAIGQLRMLGLCLDLTVAEDILDTSEYLQLTAALEKRKISLSAHAAQSVRGTLLNSLEVFRKASLDAESLQNCSAIVAAGLQNAIGGISEALGSISSQSLDRKAAIGRRRLVLAAIEEMRSDLSMPLALEALCIKLGTSERTLQYCFRQICGTTPQQFFLALRLEEGKRRLKFSPSHSITEIAFELGFSSSSHFSSLYRRLYGNCPSLFRNRH